MVLPDFKIVQYVLNLDKANGVFVNGNRMLFILLESLKMSNKNSINSEICPNVL